MVVRVQPRTLLRALLLAISFLAISHFGVRLLAELAGPERVEVLRALFHLDLEGNIPTWYSSSALLLASALLLLVALNERWEGSNYCRHWAFLSLVFLYIAADETVQIHEQVSPVIRRIFHTGGLLYHGWVIPAAIAVAVLAACYWNWLLSLPFRTGRLAVAAALIYLSGAMGMEMADDLVALHFRSTLRTAEEVLEMLGVALWIYVLADYAAARRYRLTLAFGEADSAPPHPPEQAAIAAESETKSLAIR